MSRAIAASTAVFGWPRRREPGARLSIEIGDLEDVEIGDVKGADAKPRQRQQMRAADAAEAGDGDALAGERALLLGGHPADVAREGFFVGEIAQEGARSSADCSIRAPRLQTMLSSAGRRRDRNRPAAPRARRPAAARHAFDPDQPARSSCAICCGSRAAAPSPSRQSPSASSRCSLANGFIEWIYVDMRESTIRAHLGHLQIVRPGYHEAGHADPFGYLLPEAGPALDLLRREPGVTTVAPRLSFSGLASHGEHHGVLHRRSGQPRPRGKASRARSSSRRARPCDEGDEQGALFGVGLARNLGVTVGDNVVLLVNKRAGRRQRGGARRCAVSSRPSARRTTTRRCACPIDVARPLLGARGAHTWIVLLDDTERTDAVAAESRAPGCRPNEFEVVPWHQPRRLLQQDGRALLAAGLGRSA